MTEEGGGNGGKKKKKKKRRESTVHWGPTAYPPSCFVPFFFFSYVEKCVSATNGPLKKPKQI